MKDMIVAESGGWRILRPTTNNSHPQKGTNMIKTELNQEARDSKVYEALTSGSIHPWLLEAAEQQRQRQRALWEGSTLPPARKTEHEKYLEKRKAEQQQAQAEQEAQQQEALLNAVFEACGGHVEARNEALDDAVFQALQ
jgi:hypothetical protein